MPIEGEFDRGPVEGTPEPGGLPPLSDRVRAAEDATRLAGTKWCGTATAHTEHDWTDRSTSDVRDFRCLGTEVSDGLVGHRIEQPPEPSLKQRVMGAEAETRDPPLSFGLADDVRNVARMVLDASGWPLAVGSRPSFRNGREAGAYLAGVALIVGHVHATLPEAYVDGAITAIVGASCTVSLYSSRGKYRVLEITCPVPSDIGVGAINGDDA